MFHTLGDRMDLVRSFLLSCFVLIIIHFLFASCSLSFFALYASDVAFRARWLVLLSQSAWKMHESCMGHWRNLQHVTLHCRGAWLTMQETVHIYAPNSLLQGTLSSVLLGCRGAAASRLSFTLHPLFFLQFPPFSSAGVSGVLIGQGVILHVLVLPAGYSPFAMEKETTNPLSPPYTAICIYVIRKFKKKKKKNKNKK